MAKAHLRLAAGKPIALDEDGTLALTGDTSQGFHMLSQVALLKKIAVDTDDAVRHEALRA